MKHLNNFESFSINEQRTLAALDELYNFDSLNEGFMDWIKKVGDFFEKINDSIRNLMLTMMEKGLMALELVKKFFRTVLEKIKSFKEKHPILVRTVIITLVLIVLFFVLCSAAAGKQEAVPESVLNGAIGLLRDIQKDGGSSVVDDTTLMKAQAYLFELKKGGGQISSPIFGKEVIKVATSAIKIVQDNIEEYKNTVSDEQKERSARYLLDIVEKGSKMVSYKIVEYQNALTGKYSGETVNLAFK
jgi:hypothetical protein